MKDCGSMYTSMILMDIYTLTCSHHDGTNFYEIKILTDRGIEYLNGTMGRASDKRSEQYVHEHIFKRYSKLPHFGVMLMAAPRLNMKSKLVRRRKLTMNKDEKSERIGDKSQSNVKIYE